MLLPALFLGALLCAVALGASEPSSAAPARPLAGPEREDVTSTPLEHGVPLSASLAAGETRTYDISHDDADSDLHIYLEMHGSAKGYVCESAQLASCSELYIARMTSSDYAILSGRPEGTYYIQVIATTATELIVQAETTQRPPELGMHKVLAPSNVNRGLQRFQYLVCPETRIDPELVIHTNDRNDVKLYVTAEERYIEDPSECGTGDICGQSSITIKSPSHGIYRIVAIPDQGRDGFPFNLTIYDSDVVDDAQVDGKAYDEKICETDGCALTMSLDISDQPSHQRLLLSASSTNIASSGILNIYAAMDINNINYGLEPTYNSTTGTLSLGPAELTALMNSRPSGGPAKLMVQLRSKMARVYPRDKNWETMLPFRLLAAWDVYESELYTILPSTLSSYVPEVYQAWSFAGRALERPYGAGVKAGYEAVVYYTKPQDGVLLGAYADTVAVPSSQSAGHVYHEINSTAKLEAASVLIEVGKDSGVAEGSTLFSKGFITSTAGSGTLPDVEINSIAGMVWELNDTSIVTVPSRNATSMYFRVRITSEMITENGVEISATVLGSGASGKGVQIYASKLIPLPSRTIKTWSVSKTTGGNAVLFVPMRKDHISFNEGDYLYFQVQGSDTEHSLEVYAAPKGKLRAMEIGSGRLTNFLFASKGTTGKFVSTLSGSYIMGYSGEARRKVLVAVELNEQVNSDQFEGMELMASVTNQYYDGDANRASSAVGTKNLLAQRLIKGPHQGPDGKWLNSRIYLIADVRDARPLYITVTRMGKAAPSDKPISIRLIAGGYDTLEEDISYPIYLPRSTGTRNFYAFETAHGKDWKIELEAYRAPESSYSIIVCPMLPPIELAGPFETERCLAPQALVPDTPLTIEYSSDAEGYVSGIYYIAVIANNAATDLNAHFSMKVTSTAKHGLGTTTTSKTFGGKSYYFKYELPDDEAVEAQEMNFYGVVQKCSNCAVCLSISKEHPQFDPTAWKESGGEDKGDCDLVLGMLREEQDDPSDPSGPDDPEEPEEPEEKLYQASGHLPVVDGAKAVYGTLLNLNTLGISDTVLFYGALERACQVDKFYTISLGKVADGAVGTTDDGRPYYSKYHFQFPMDDVVEYATFSVGPVGTSMQELLTTVYGYYISFHDPCPDLSTAEFFGDYEVGHNPKSFRKDEMNGSRVAYVTLIATGDTPSRYVDTSVAFSVDPDSLIYPMGYMQYTPSPVVSTGKKRVYHFDVSTFPVDIIMEPCRGYPVIRGGVTDFFRRSDGDNSPEANAVEQAERVYTLYNIPMFDEAVVRLRGGTRYTTGSWFFEVGDYRIAMSNWSVSLFAASTDPRPAVPVGKLQVYSAGKGMIEVTFHPANPVNHNGVPSDLEYAVYGLAGNAAEELDDEYWNHRAACGYLQGGVQLSNWTTFDDWDEFFTIETTTKPSSVSSGDVWVTVLVRAKSTLLFKAFTPVLLKKGSAPPLRSQMEGWEIALTVTVVVVFLIALAVGLALFFLRRKAKKEVRAHGEKQFMGLDKETLPTDVVPTQAPPDQPHP